VWLWCTVKRMCQHILLVMHVWTSHRLYSNAEPILYQCSDGNNTQWIKLSFQFNSVKFDSSACMKALSKEMYNKSTIWDFQLTANRNRDHIAYHLQDIFAYMLLIAFHDHCVLTVDLYWRNARAIGLSSPQCNLLSLKVHLVGNNSTADNTGLNVLGISGNAMKNKYYIIILLII